MTRHNTLIMKELSWIEELNCHWTSFGFRYAAAASLDHILLVANILHIIWVPCSDYDQPRRER